jgi:hypothetical protein
VVVLGATHNSGAFLCCQHDARIDIPGCNWRQLLVSRRKFMKPLSEQLSDLADRAK